MRVRRLLIVGLVSIGALASCASRDLDGAGGPSDTAGAAGDEPAAGSPGTQAGMPGQSGYGHGHGANSGEQASGAGDGGTQSGRGGSGATSTSSDGGVGGSGGYAADGTGEDPCSDGGQGGACPGQRDPVCVTDCSSVERTPAIVDADGSVSCPESAPLREEECHIDCSELYDASIDEDPYVCGAGSFCRQRMSYAYFDSCTGEVDQNYDTNEPCRCTRIPAECPATVQLDRPACGADRKSYANLCEMWRARMDGPGEYEGCPDDRPGFFYCRDTYCREGVEFCAIYYGIDDSDVPGGRCVESACAASGDNGCECLVEELGAAVIEDLETEEPVPAGYSYCNDSVEGELVVSGN